MGSHLQSKLEKLPASRRKKVEARGQELIDEVLSLRDLRKALSITQNELSVSLNMQQDGISRLEHRSDMLLSTLRKYVEAMGGTLKLTVEFPSRPTVVLRGFEDLNSSNDSKSNSRD